MQAPMQQMVPFTEYKDKHGKSYWHNSVTGESTWTCPFPSVSGQQLPVHIPSQQPVQQPVVDVRVSVGDINTLQTPTKPPVSAYKAVLFQAAGSTSSVSTSSSSSESSCAVSMKSVGQSEEDDWVREAEVHFNAIAPPQTSVDKSIAAMQAHAQDVEEAQFMEEMLAARAKLDMPVTLSL